MTENLPPKSDSRGLTTVRQSSGLISGLQKMVFHLLHSRLRHSVRIKSFLYQIVYLLPEKWRMPDEVRQALKQIADTQKNVFFVNIGSNDGLAGNPLREFIVTRHWKGIMVEPVAYVFERLVRVYKNRPEIHCENVAIGDKNGSKTFYFLRKNNVLPPGYDQVGSFSKEKILGEDHIFPGLAAYIQEREIQCVTLRELLARRQVRHVDVYLIDAEGFDYEILKQIDLQNDRPLMIILEVAHLSPDDKSACNRLLEHAGYCLKQVTGDLLAFLPPAS